MIKIQSYFDKVRNNKPCFHPNQENTASLYMSVIKLTNKLS